MTEHNTSGPKSPHPEEPPRQWGTDLHNYQTAALREIVSIRGALFGLDIRFDTQQHLNEFPTEWNWLCNNDYEWCRSFMDFPVSKRKVADP